MAALSTLFIACGVPSARVSTWSEPDPGVFTTGPYILIAGQGKAFIAMKAQLDKPPIVEWWVAGRATASTDSGAREPDVTRVSAELNADLWIATLEKLPVGEHIEYRVVSEAGNTEPATFRVGTKPGESFRFAAFGDTRTGHDIHRAVVEAMAREDLEFVAHTGDMVERGGIQKQWDLFFQIERPLLVSTPIVPAIGNHDMGRRRYFRHYFMHRRWTRNRRYFAHDWGNLRVLVIDGGIECRDGCEQYAYAERVLAEGAEQGKLMVMMLHYPPYSSGKHGSNKAVQKSISELAQRHGVELVLAGHDHNYERTKKIGGVTFIVSGSAGAPIRPVRPQWFTAEARTEPHYVLVDVEPNRLVVRAINLKGDAFDSVVLLPNPPAKR